MSSNADPQVKAVAAELFQTVVDTVAQREQVRTQALADSWETPMPSIQRNTTNNYTATNSAPDPAPAPVTPPAATPAVKPGLSTLAKVGIGAAMLAIPGAGIAGIATGVLGSWIGSKFNQPAVTAPAPPNGKVTIGIGPDGKLFDPNAGAAK